MMYSGGKLESFTRGILNSDVKLSLVAIIAVPDMDAWKTRVLPGMLAILKLTQTEFSIFPDRLHIKISRTTEIKGELTEQIFDIKVVVVTPESVRKIQGVKAFTAYSLVRDLSTNQLIEQRTEGGIVYYDF